MVPAPTEVHRTLTDDFNATDNEEFLGKRLDEVFESIAAHYGSSIAVIDREAQLTYKQLNELANHLARRLVALGVHRGDVVGMALERTIQLPIAIMAILKSGAAFVPIDIHYPTKRIRDMIEIAEPRAILTGNLLPPVLRPWKHLCHNAQHLGDQTTTNTANLCTNIHPRDPAYIIYTSGSTGRPKGMEISHGAAVNYLLSLRERQPGCGSHDRFLAVSTISFDMGIGETFLPLISGAQLVLAPADAGKNPRNVIALLNAHQITMMQATPAMWQMLLDCGWKRASVGLKAIVGGEPLTRRLANRLLQHVISAWNVYGPSEITYGVVWKVSEQGEILVGQPIANGRVYLLDEEMKPVPLDEDGRLYFGGGSVSNGYRRNPELTKERFLSNPFHKGTLFRSDDIGRFIAPGKLRLLGRIQGLIKVRGFRVEAGDVEAAILEHQGISEAVVMLRGDRLVAYCVKKVPALTQTNGTTRLSLNELLRPWLADRLPSFMIPAFFVDVEKFPLSPNLKIDRDSLPDPISSIHVRPEMEPTSQMEQQIAAIWAEVLGHDRIEVDDNFYQIGGDSIRLIRLQVALEKSLNRSVSTPELFEHYTKSAQARHITVKNDSGKRDSSLQKHGSNPVDTGDDDIAIVSMACRLPGGVETPDDFWSLLRDGTDAITEIPKDRWDADAIYDADPDAIGKSYCRHGGFLASIGLSDPAFFGISPVEARSMHPSHHLMLEICHEAFQRAGYTTQSLMNSETGVFIGISENASTDQGYGPEFDGYSLTGSASATISGRLSYLYGLRGASMTIDTACSSSLVATHLACNALRQGECDMAVAGGVNLILNPGIHIEFSRLRGMSPDGRCRAFSADTQGTGFSEGAAAIVLKRLRDAQRDGDIVHAVLRASAVGHAGRTSGLTAPSTSSQVRLIRRSLRAAGLEPSDIDVVEAHGTATKLGDPIEGAALAEVFRSSHAGGTPLWIGSSKSNIGHTGAAAGVVGVMKMVLAMREGLIPRTLHVSKPTPSVNWMGGTMALACEQQSWAASIRTDRRRRAGVSSYGISGTGAHVILEEPPISESHVQSLSGHCEERIDTVSIPILVSAATDKALRAQMQKLAHFLDDNKLHKSLKDIAYSLATSRTHFRRRQVMNVANENDLQDQLAAATCSMNTNSIGDTTRPAQPYLALVFTGQGSQYPGMGKTLYHVYPAYRKALDEVVALFSELETPLLNVMWAPPSSQNAALLRRAEYSQPAIFSLEVALWRLWESWGIRPKAVLGHSIGEYAAAHVAGVFDLQDACKLVAARSRLMGQLSMGGSMASIHASAREVVRSLETLGQETAVSIAAYNSPTQIVVSGDSMAVHDVITFFQDQGRRVKVLDVSHAYHSHHVDYILTDFSTALKSVDFQTPRLAVVCGSTGKFASPSQLEDSEYWVRQIRDAVHFSQGMSSLAHLGVNMYLELGPQPTLCGLGAECLSGDLHQGATPTWLYSLHPGRDDVQVMLRSLGELHVRNFDIDWAGYFKPFSCHRVELPTYPFQRDTTWIGFERSPQINGTDRCQLSEPKHSAQSTSSDASEVSRMSQPIKGASLMQAKGAERETLVIQLVQQVVSKVIGFSSPSDVEIDRSLQDMGMDSLNIILIRNSLAKATGLKIDLNLVLDADNTRALSKGILARVQSAESGR